MQSHQGSESWPGGARCTLHQHSTQALGMSSHFMPFTPARYGVASASGASETPGAVHLCMYSTTAPHKDFSDLYGEMSGKRASASEAHRLHR